MSGAVRSSPSRLTADSGRHPTNLFPLAAGDGAFAALYREHKPGVYAAALRVLGRPSDAEDVAQDVFVRFWRDPDRFDPRRGTLGGYLRLMARSRALDLWRHERAAGRAHDRLKLVSGDERARPDEHPADTAEREEERHAVRTALRRLPRPQREALALSYWGGLRPQEIASRTGVPFGTARSRMRLGIERLRQDWVGDPVGGEEPEAA